ncbi:MAG: nucleoside-diphosphate kinase [Candidatus Thermoplasmatota archaeon]|nr:nucleoside-diphosphate kinase [Candidatus Thermoplasmatota archaeon]MCL5930822.1 nucleoside-diphosphate kinase [Candidatus Thermoplasmatota archaeon]
MRTLVLIKPDGVARSKVGAIISRFEDKGLKVTALKLMKLDRERAEKHYAVHKGKPFYESLLNYITSAPLVAMVVEGNNCIEIVRKLVGATNGAKAEPGTIRGDFSTGIDFNLIHASDSEESAKYEIPIFFDEREILTYERADRDWL